MDKIKQVLSNSIFMPIILTLGFIGWFLGIYQFTLPLLGLFSFFVLIFCDDPKNIFPIILMFGMFVPSHPTISDYIVITISVIIAIIGAIYFTIKQFVLKRQMRKGKMFWAFIVELIVLLLGGIIGHFNILHSLLVFAFVLLTYFIYWLSINFTQNLKTFLFYSFIAMGFILTAQILISYAFVDDTFFNAISSKNIFTIGLININMVAVYTTLATISAFALGYKHKRDYLFILLGMFFALVTYFTYSRICTLICFLALVGLIIFTFIKSNNKKILLITGGTFLLIAGIFVGIYFEEISYLLTYPLKMGISGNGRETLWPWCWEQFVENPVFGVGFVSEDAPVPGGYRVSSIILAHNTVLQYLTSTGVVGTIIITYFYFKKYKTLCEHFSIVKLFNLVGIIAIALTGITDKAPTMDIFIVLISVLLISTSEIDTEMNKGQFPAPKTRITKPRKTTPIKKNHKHKEEA